MLYTRITEIRFNNGQILSINPNDIVVFVGPNNAGKSQSLRDIYDILGNANDTVVIKSLTIEKGDESEVCESIIANSKAHGSTNGDYNGYGYHISQMEFPFYKTRQFLGNSFRGYLVSFLKTDNRLGISAAPNTIDADEVKTHPIHYVLYDKDYQRKISNYFNEAFGYELIPNYLSRKKVPLLMGGIPQREKGGSLPDIMEEMEGIINTYPRVDEQGDGMRSFTGVVLHLIMKNYGMYLIDEPESFLHPPQAKIIGRVIGELLGEERQAFISTHSEDVIKGLMETSLDRIKVVRITRSGNVNSFAILDNAQFKNIWGDPLLKHSNIMSGLFHRNVVLCESDSDCRLYSIILDYLKQKEGKYTETLFTYCSGKQRMKQVASALRSLSVDFRCVPDIDVFNEKQTIKSLFEACGGVWDDTMESSYNTFVGQLNGGKTMIPKAELKKCFSTYLDGVVGDNLSRADLENLEKLLKIETKWSELKKGGINAIPSGQATNAFKALHALLRAVNIFPVPVGELERFVREVGGHGPSWVNSVLEQYSDLSDDVYAEVRAFVASWNL